MSQTRVPRTLYRQLLSWCRQYKDVPFDGVPPLTLTPPQVNSMALKRLRSMRSFLDKNHIKDSTKQVKWRHPAHYALYNNDVSVGENMIVFPKVHDANELRDVIRSIYWLNNNNTTSSIDLPGDHVEQERETSPESEKEQISLAFDAIKSCNQLSSSELDSRRNRRQTSIDIRQKQNDYADAPDVKYHVGQVVSQKTKGWRGVIVGWNIENKSDQNRLTSLTTKHYSISEHDENSNGGKKDENHKYKIKYTILVDVNDAALLETSKIVSLETEEDLVPVEPILQRIHNNLINQYFTRFESDHFLPNNVLSYVYPLDYYSGGVDRTSADCGNAEPYPESFRQSCSSIIEGIDKINKQLMESFIVDNSPYLQSLQSQLTMQQDLSQKQPISRVYSAISAFSRFHVKVNTAMLSRSIHSSHKPNIKFSLGQIVRHKLYDYRGVIVAWDHKPYVDVTHWDGLQHVQNPQNQPFYHIRPDENDCIRAFGGPRSFRYVCQENLELCEGTELVVDDLNSQEWRWDGVKRAYIPSEEMRFLYGEPLDSAETKVVEECLQKLRDILTNCLLFVRDKSNHKYFTMDDLFDVLQSADSLEHATTVVDAMKEIWKETNNRELRTSLDTGITLLVEGNHDKALSTFTKITELDPTYAEAWNKKATAHYMMGHMRESLEAARRALEIEPMNFQALAGIGLVEMDSSSSVDKAISAFRQCLSLNPWSMVSGRLAICLRKVDRDNDHGLE